MFSYKKGHIQFDVKNAESLKCPECKTDMLKNVIEPPRILTHSRYACANCNEDVTEILEGATI